MASWQPDVLSGYEAYTIDLPEAPVASGEAVEGLCATLIKRMGCPKNRRAVLYLHGWNDYFFQTEVADLVTGLGIDFYALDLRRYGRSLRPGQLPGYIDSLADYSVEIGAALEAIRADHDSVGLMGHSTGGLIASVYAAMSDNTPDALLLNSPWLDLSGFAVARKAARQLAEAWSKLAPTAEIPMPSDGGFYAHMTHLSLGGEWDYNLAWKSPVGAPILAGWIRAVLGGQAKVAAGLAIPVPILVCCSARSDFSRTWSPVLRRTDIVLDVEMIARRAIMLGPTVTIDRIDGGMHDLALSDLDARQRYFHSIERWINAYWPEPE